MSKIVYHVLVFFYIKFVAVFRNPHLGTFWKFTDVVWDLYLGRLFSPARQITSQTAGPQLWTKHRSPSAFQSGEFCGIYETWGEPHWTFQNERMQPQIEGRSLIRCQVKIWSFLNCLSDCFNFGLESCFSTFNLTYGNKREQYVKFMFIFHQTHKNHKDRRQITLVRTGCKIFTSFRVIDH